jgi:hypothetical protein
MTAREFITTWFLRLGGPVIAPLTALIVCVWLMQNSFVSSMFHDFAFRFPKWLKALFWGPWYPTAFYYQWQYPSGGCGPARWMWRQPKQPNWRLCDNWWVFKG